MKKLILTPVLALLFVAGSVLTAQNRPEEYLGLPGDNLNLFAVMNLFQNSETLEAFERELNNPDNMINNLDLNRDGYVDYIMVHDYQEGNIHNIVLRVALNQRDYQDVAVFVVQRFRDNSVQVQLIGDEALYGPNYIVEPVYAETPNPGYRGNVVQQRPVQQRNVTVVHTTYYEVATWPVIVYISRPVYRPWRSAWYWGYHPIWWSPWRAHYWHFYFGYHYHWHSHYYAHFRPWRHHRCVHYHTVYVTNVRHYSPTVVVNINQGNYRSTYSRPESRREGEVLFTQRHPNGTTVPGSRSAVNNAGGRHSATGAGQVSDTQATRSGAQGRSAGVDGSTPVSGAGRSETSRQNAGVSSGDRVVQPVNRQAAERNNNAAVSSERDASSARPAAQPVRNQNANLNSDQPAQRPAARPANATPSRESAPAVSRQQGQTDRNREATSAPAQQRVQQPTQQRTQPSAPAARQASPQARPATDQNTRNAAPAVQSTSPNRSSSSSSSGNVSSSPSRSSSSSTPSSVGSSSSSRSSSSTPSVQSSGSSRGSSSSAAPARSGSNENSSRRR